MKQTRYYVALRLRKWDGMKVEMQGVTLPVGRGDLPSIGYLPVFTTMTALRKEFGNKTPFSVIEEVQP